jgi:hypothetical protein
MVSFSLLLIDELLVPKVTRDRVVGSISVPIHNFSNGPLQAEFRNASRLSVTAFIGITEIGQHM